MKELLSLFSITLIIFGNSVTAKSYFSDDMHSFLEKRLNLKMAVPLSQL